MFVVVDKRLGSDREVDRQLLYVGESNGNGKDGELDGETLLLGPWGLTNREQKGVVIKRACW